MLRGDSGFCRDELMSWCEENEVDYVFGLAKNTRVVSQIEDELEIAKELHEETGLPERVYAEFDYRTIDSWDRSRRVVAKAEHLEKGSNPRFVVTSFPRDHAVWRGRKSPQISCPGRAAVRHQKLHVGLAVLPRPVILP